MRTKKYILAAAFFMAAFLPAFGQDVDVKKLPGYIDLDKIVIPADAEEVTEIDLGPGLLKMMSRFAGENDESDSSVFSGVFSIRVKSFEASGDRVGKIRSIMDDIEKKLNADKWENVVRVKKKDAYTTVSMLVQGERTIGTMIMSIDDDNEVFFANIVGNFNIEKISELGLGLDDSTMHSIRKSWDSY